MNFTEKLVDVATKQPILKKVTPYIGQAALALKRVSPELYLVAGLAAGVAAGVAAARAYKKHDEVLGEVKAEIALAQEYFEENPAETPRERAEVVAPLYGKYAGRFITLYGKTISLSLLSLYMVLKSHGLMRGRNQALAAALGIVQKSFETYRKRVVEEVGEEADERFYTGADKKVVVTATKDEETGRTKKEKSEVNIIPEDADSGLSMYARIFDESNKNFYPNKETNYHFLQVAQKHWNDILDIKGWVMLNDIHDYLKMPRTAAGQIVGWSLKAQGDNWIDFGLDRPINRNSGDNRFVLDFNVNGPVYEYLDNDRG